MKIIRAEKEQSAEIASLIMEAMNYECCRNLAGPDHSLFDFFSLMQRLVACEDSQYSYLNTLVAMSENPYLTEGNEVLQGRGILMGACVSYDGGLLHQLRQKFIDESLKDFGIDHSDMPDETQAGELYIDTLCTNSEFRCQGVATNLIKETLRKATSIGFSKVGLLVDKGNPSAEQFYTKLGFEYVDDNSFGGHPMKHLQIKI